MWLSNLRTNSFPTTNYMNLMISAANESNEDLKHKLQGLVVCLHSGGDKQNCMYFLELNASYVYCF